MLEGWTINNNFSYVGSFAVNPTSTDDLAGTGDGERWTLVGNPSDFVFGGAGTVPCNGVKGSTLGNSGACGTPDAIPSGAVLGTAAYVSNMPAACVTAAEGEAVNTAMNLATPGSSNPLTSLGKEGCYVVGNTVMVPPAAGTFGTMDRNELRDKPIPNWDFSLLKDWKLKERYTIEFRGELFNVINRTEYAVPFTSLLTPATFGLSEGTPNYNNPINGNGGPRTLQLGLKFIF
jgi:hypothetical protein